MEYVAHRENSELIVPVSLMVLGKLRFGKSRLSSFTREKTKEQDSLAGFSFINIVSGFPLVILGTLCLWLEKLFPYPSNPLPKGITCSCYECRYKRLISNY